MKEKKSNLQLLHVSSAKSWRGGEQQLAYLAEGLKEKGISQWILCVKGSLMEDFCEKNDLPFYSYSKGFSLNPFVSFKICRLCKKLGITLLHTHDSHSHTFAVISAALFRNRKSIIVHRRVDFPVGGSWFSRWKYNHKLVRKIICTSNFIREIMAPAVRDSSLLEVVHSGIDLKKFHFTKSPGQEPGPLRQEFSVSPEVFIIANVSAIAPHKDYFTFVRTAKLLIEKGFPAKFFIIGGDGGVELQIRHFIKEQRLENHFFFTGHRSDVPQILPDIDLLLLTSKTEGFGGTVLGAFAARVPVVATATGGVPEVVENKVTGLVAPVGDAKKLAELVEKVLTEPALRERLVEKAKQQVHRFSKANMVEGILKIYLAVNS